METNTSFEASLRQFLTPIINEAVDKAISRHFSAPVVPQTTQAEILDIKLAAEFLHLSVPTIYTLVHNQTIPNYKQGKRLYFKKEDLIRWIETGRRKTILEVREEADRYLDRGKRRGR